MEKEVVRFKRSTTIKDDICYDGKNFTPVFDEENCENCRVHILTDAFLSKKFQKKIMKDDRPYPRGTYPYILITESSGCNLRCRPCYSWIFREENKNRADPAMIDSEDLASLFKCKINKLTDESALKGKRIGEERWKRPFARLRISGGEPLFDENDPERALKFWIEFFDSLDKEYDSLVNQKISLMSEKEWKEASKEEKTEKFPIFLKSESGKIRIRFDTNGFLFSDKKFTERFVKEIYDLNLQNFTIDLTYSLKGTNKHEVNWMIGPNSEFNPSKVGKKEPLKEHPQWLPLKNLKEAITEYEEEDILEKNPKDVMSKDNFNPHGDLSITVERGIMNNPDEKLYLYDRKRSLPWERFEDQLREKGLKISKADNSIYFGMNKKAKAWSYIKRGDYEILFRRESDENPPYSYSKKKKSIMNSKEHKQVTDWNGKNLEELENKIKYVQNNDLEEDEHWIELIPLNLE